MPLVRLTVLIHVLLFWGLAAMQGQLAINEVVASNSETTDNYGQTPDWVELKNEGDFEIDLEDYYLSDDSDNLLKWNLPDIELNPNELFLVFGMADSTDEFHFSFGIGLDGEQLYLTHNQDGLAQELEVPSLRQNHSYGIPEGEGDYKFFETPTPNAANTNESYFGYAPSPTLSHVAGFYENEFDLIIFPPFNGGQLHYTLDGSEPSLTSPIYDTPLTVDSSQVVKAVFIQDGWLSSDLDYGTYLIGVDHSLPVVSLSCAHDSLFDPITGLYMEGLNADEEWPYFGANYWEEREIPVAFEYFENGSLKFEQQVGLQMHGGKSSRTKKQRPFRLTARSQYESDFMEYAFFHNKPQVAKFRHLVLRNSGADFLKTNFRDGYWHQVALDEGLDFEAFGFQPAIVYINGEYWGIMSLREKVSEFYCSENSEADPDSVIIGEIENEPFIGDTIHYHNLSEFIINEDMSIDENFAYAASKIDIQSYQDYFALEIFAGNPDWPANNIKFWKPGVSIGKWRYILFDLDTTMAFANWLTFDWDMFDWVFGEKSEALNSKIFVNLLENAEFTRLFLNRMADLMNTKLNTESMRYHYDEVMSIFEPEIEAHFDRWNGNPDLWVEHAEIRLPNFMDARPEHVQDQIVNHFGFDQKVNLTFECFPPEAGTIQINTMDPYSFFQGVYFSGNAIDITVANKTGYEFDHWAFSEHWIDSPAETHIQQNFRESGTLVAVFKEAYEETFFTLNNTGEASNFQFVYQSRQKDEFQIQVTDSSGRIVLSGKKFMEEGKNFFSLDFSQESSGIYVVQLIGQGEQKALTLYVP